MSSRGRWVFATRFLYGLLALATTGCDSKPAGNMPASEPAVTVPEIPEVDHVERFTPTSGDAIGEVDQTLTIERADKFRFTPSTRISVTTDFAPAIAAATRIRKEFEAGFANRVTDPCIERLRESGRPWAIGAWPGQISDDGVNVLMNLTIGPNANGKPYRVSLSARQGKAIWTASIERPEFLDVPGIVPISQTGTTPDGRPYWSPDRDTSALADRLCQHLLNGASDANE